jgi:hypothetical protein
MRIATACALAFIAACTSGDTQKLAIGSPCKVSADCGTGKFFCATDHPSGYCKAVCHSDADCPTGSVCAGAGSVSPGECHKVCNALGDCRFEEGYICKLMPDDASHAYCDIPEGTGDGGA